ncbi:hypothetical protein BsWGS_23261 [Bradybaena similaris]
MKSGQIFIYLCFCEFLWYLALCVECPYKECDCFPPDIFCLGKGLQSMPQLNNISTTTDYTTLLLDDNQIEIVSAGSLLPNLTVLSLLNNPVTSIDDTAFIDSSKTLNILSISNARFTRMPNALLSLQNLHELQIKQVGDLDWNEDVMKVVGSTVRILYLEEVNLTTPPDWLQYFSQVTQLTIIGSNLSSLPDTAMDKMANTAITICFTNNALTEVPKALSNLTSLQFLHLRNNRISSTKWLPTSSRLSYLTLNENHIFNSTELSESLSPYANSLVGLNIEDNDLDSLQDLSKLTRLGSLSFKNNKISNYSQGALPSGLSILDLENNLLSTIPVMVPGLENIIKIVLRSNMITQINDTDLPPRASTVVLSFNLITELNDDSFPENSVIENLFLNNNPIYKISPAAFANLHRLEVLSLQSTKLTRVPVALSSLEGLGSLDITNIAGLVCTCQEKGVAQWVQARESYRVIGDCGEISVYNFFTKLDPGCL